MSDADYRRACVTSEVTFALMRLFRFYAVRDHKNEITVPHRRRFIIDRTECRYRTDWTERCDGDQQWAIIMSRAENDRGQPRRIDARCGAYPVSTSGSAGSGLSVCSTHDLWIDVCVLCSVNQPTGTVSPHNPCEYSLTRLKWCSIRIGIPGVAPVHMDKAYI